MVGADRLQAISLARRLGHLDEGAAAGLARRPRDPQPADAYFLPTTTGHLLKVRPANGEIVSDVETDLPLGQPGGLQGPDHFAERGLAVGLLSDRTAARVVARRLQDNPDDVWALGTLRRTAALRRPACAQAVEVLRHAYRLAPQDDAIRTALVQALMAALRDDFANNRQFAIELETLIDQPAQQAEFYRLMAVGLRNSARWISPWISFSSWPPWITAPPRWTPRTTGWTWCGWTRICSVRRDRWIAVNLGEILAQADERVASADRRGRHRAVRRGDATASRCGNCGSSSAISDSIRWVRRCSCSWPVCCWNATSRSTRNSTDSAAGVARSHRLRRRPPRWLADLLRAPADCRKPAAVTSVSRGNGPTFRSATGQTGKDVAAAALADEPCSRRSPPPSPGPMAK